MLHDKRKHDNDFHKIWILDFDRIRLKNFLPLCYFCDQSWSAQNSGVLSCLKGEEREGYAILIFVRPRCTYFIIYFI